MSDETVTIVDRNHALPWDTDVFNVAVTTGAGGVAVLTSSTSCGYSNNDVESIAIPWPDILKHAPQEALEAAYRASPHGTPSPLIDRRKLLHRLDKLHDDADYPMSSSYCALATEIDEGAFDP